MCGVEDCERLVHSKGLCQNHYRKAQRKARGLKRPGPRPKEGAVSHQRLDPEERERRKMDRRAAQTHCVNGHEFTFENTTLLSSGQKVCKICTRASQQKFHGRTVDTTTPIGPKNSDKTHCPHDHDYTPENTHRKKDGSRDCKRCLKARRIAATYGVTLEQFEGELEKQGWKCGICSKPFLTEPDAQIDHCHKTGEYRGLLCTSCNNGLGRFFDSPDLLRKAADYLTSGRLATS